MSSNYRRVRGRKRPPVLYHWSPRRNRARILKHGLRPNELSVDRDWRPPYVCFADTPFMGWKLCLNFRAGEIIDLYEVWLSGYLLYRRHDFGPGISRARSGEPETDSTYRFKAGYRSGTASTVSPEYSPCFPGFNPTFGP